MIASHSRGVCLAAVATTVTRERERERERRPVSRRRAETGDGETGRRSVRLPATAFVRSFVYFTFWLLFTALVQYYFRNLNGGKKEEELINVRIQGR